MNSRLTSQEIHTIYVDRPTNSSIHGYNVKTEKSESPPHPCLRNVELGGTQMLELARDNCMKHRRGKALAPRRLALLRPSRSKGKGAQYKEREGQPRIEEMQGLAATILVIGCRLKNLYGGFG
jgi:hypothetical protein